jgi:alkanesulfonate monooxygenase SsuD/methylene tetrahydromethanopterin reductase-like flavin-dependent oxidoreductase (luciferase family)
VPQLYAEVVGQAVLADELGYDTFFVAEHHFHEYGAVPNPPVILAAIAAQTKTLRLGTAIAALNYRNPIEVAESYAMLDVLSGGRLFLGVGSGYLAHEFQGFGMDPATKRESFDRNFAEVRRLLAGAPTANDMRIQVRPLQNPVPLAVGILRAEAAYYVGRQGFDMLSVPYASCEGFDDIATLIAEHHRGLTEAGRSDLDEASVIVLHAHVAETDAQARAEAAAAFDDYVASRLYARRSTYDDAMRNGLSLMGGIETVVDKLVALADMGVGHVGVLPNFGALPDHLVRRSLVLFAEEAIPQAMRKLAARRAA